jgi:hypothetical protein
VKITGSDLSGASAVLFGGRPAASFTVEKLNIVTAVSPPGSATVGITVVTPRGESAASESARFTYTSGGPPAPTVTKLSRKKGPTSGGTRVKITGTGFVHVQAVEFGSSAASSFVVNSSGSITAVSPAGSAGSVYVRVTTAAGSSATASKKDLFKYVIG